MPNKLTDREFRNKILLKFGFKISGGLAKELHRIGLEEPDEIEDFRFKEDGGLYGEAEIRWLGGIYYFEKCKNKWRALDFFHYITYG